MPVYNPAEHLVEALESLLAQTYGDFRLVLVDDRSKDETPEVVERYWAIDDRISYHRNERRLGLTRNWRRTFELAMEACPDAEYFAWVSDHDVWHPRWLEVLLREIDRRPDASIVFPLSAVLAENRGLDQRAASVDTSDTGSFGRRLYTLSRRLRAGHVVYGLCRASTVRRAGVFRHVLYADRLLVTELGFYGALVSVPETLWYKRPTGKFSVRRQRAACFPDGTPPYAALPWWLQHAWCFAWFLGVRGKGRPLISRSAAFSLAVQYIWWNAGLIGMNRWRWYRKAHYNWMERRPEPPADLPPRAARLEALRSRARGEARALKELVRAR
jgi:glycosyltransferase involved in cell wall biosynthesis